VTVETFGTNKVPESKIVKAVNATFDLRPYGIVKMLDLLKPIYRKTASYGHFGRNEFSWEKTDRAAKLKAACK
jgi:S-adenosylmethionine synthetase